MEKIVAQGLLYDFYGELLTEHQRRIYEAAVFDDLSPSEIAKEQGISRQGVHDLMKRCDKILEDYEAKLHLVAKFLKIRDMAEEVKTLAGECARTKNMDLIGQIWEISDKITSTL
ncbi:YlxM family DNA-binding protein [Lacrimispora sp. 210928-DFI.3.58]|uniref:YlxM family DNA-binding protein n=1 Tax=Lacrimispora sp. 210928-DFI.3.58 TaxID=2883214 RepID=UPI0015B70699|nr:YlxM family DNA-binding protein [Lacrimispora sp. 210928-DFI.3.58]MCB7319054.1 YlxM family DNA-binding protein [Lacrimispora sp. 210928-DFI.3.58]